jgi:N-hydroxyarylamine O-acetyltransferase
MNLAAYFARIGYDGPLVATRAVLADLMLHHTRSIPFENLDAFVGRRVSLDPVDVERKLVHDRRGGWCFEQNLLLGEALRALGFEVIDLAGRVVWGRPADAVAARTHRVLKVCVEGCELIVDVGFGGQTPTGLLDLDRNDEQATPHEPFRLRNLGAEYLLETKLNDEWLPMYRFDLVPQQPIDFEAANFQLVLDPASHFTQGLRVSRVAHDGRHALRGAELAFHGADGRTRRRTLVTADEVLAALADPFGIRVPDADLLRRRLMTTGTVEQ